MYCAKRNNRAVFIILWMRGRGEIPTSNYKIKLKYTVMLQKTVVDQCLNEYSLLLFSHRFLMI